MSIFWTNLLVNEFRTAMGGGLLGISKKNYFHFQNLTKNGNKVWTIKKAEMTLLFSLVFSFFLFFENIQNRQFFWKNLLVNEFRIAMGGGKLGL